MPRNKLERSFAKVGQLSELFGPKLQGLNLVESSAIEGVLRQRVGEEIHLDGFE
jgi:hypothetical protein